MEPNIKKLEGILDEFNVGATVHDDLKCSIESLNILEERVQLLHKRVLTTHVSNLKDKIKPSEVSEPIITTNNEYEVEAALADACEAVSFACQEATVLKQIFCSQNEPEEKKMIYLKLINQIRHGDMSLRLLNEEIADVNNEIGELKKAVKEEQHLLKKALDAKRKLEGRTDATGSLIEAEQLHRDKERQTELIRCLTVQLIATSDVSLSENPNLFMILKSLRKPYKDE